MAVEDLDVVGRWPDFQGKALDALIAQESWFEGERDDEANVVWLCGAGAWHKLYFDDDAVFWKTVPAGPNTAGSDDTADFPLNDLAARHSLTGQRITDCTGDYLDGGSEVALHFEGGRTVTFRNRFDTTSVIVAEG